MKFLLICSLIIPLLISCSRSPFSTTWSPGTCIIETNKTYAPGHAPKGHIYKIDGILEDEGKYQVSVFYLGDWQYLKRKPASYFEESQYFQFEEVACPDGTTQLGLKHRIKNWGENS